MGFLRDTVSAALGARRLLNSLQPRAVWVNTLTVPVWQAASALARIPSVVHVHEAEDDGHRVVRTALVSPLTLAKIGVVNSNAAARAITRVLPLLERRLELVYNGVPGPDREPQPRQRGNGTTHIALVGRLSPRKGTDIVLDAVGQLRSAGYDVHLDLYGAVFPGYEWFEEELRQRANQADLVDSITFHGYVRPVWDSLSEADIVVVPSRVEPFGNVAVEAQLAHRPVIVSAVQGLTEIVTDGVNGLHAKPESPDDLARALRELLDEPDYADKLADAGQVNATSRFTVERYQQEVARVLAQAVSAN